MRRRVAVAFVAAANMSSTYLTAAVARAADATKTTTDLAAELKPLLLALEPESMMKDGGLEKATAAIVQLEKAANLMNTAAAIASVNGGVAILIQTCVLHPVPALRMHATATLAACTRANDENFAKAAIERRLPEAMVRVLREEDRRIKKDVEESTGGKAHDPDLPTRRLALEGVAALLGGTMTAKALLALPGVICTLFGICQNSDPTLRRRGTLLLRALLVDGDQTYFRGIKPQPSKAVEYIAMDGEFAAEVAGHLCAAASEEDAEVADAAVRVMLALKASEPLRGALKELGAEQAATEQAESTEVAAAAARLRELAKWVRG